MICGSGGSISRLAKAAGAEPAGQMRDEKLHAVVARSTFRRQKCKQLRGSEHFWKLRCRKSARCCGAKHISKSKVQKTVGYGALLDVQMCFRVAGARDCAPCQEWAKREGFVAFPKTMAGVGHLTRICKDGFRVAGAVQETCPGVFISWEGLHFGASDLQVCWMILRDRCSTSYDLASLFRGRRSSLDRWRGKIAKRIGTRPSALHSTFHFWRTSRRIASFLMLSTLTNEEVSQNCFVFDVVKFKNWGSLAELLRFWMLSSSKTEEVSLNCCVFKLAGRQTDRQADKPIDRI